MVRGIFVAYGTLFYVFIPRIIQKQKFKAFKCYINIIKVKPFPLLNLGKSEYFNMSGLSLHVIVT